MAPTDIPETRTRFSGRELETVIRRALATPTAPAAPTAKPKASDPKPTTFRPVITQKMQREIEEKVSEAFPDLQCDGLTAANAQARAQAKMAYREVLEKECLAKLVEEHEMKEKKKKKKNESVKWVWQST